MQRSLLLLLAILTFVQMASANPFDNFGEQFPDFIEGSIYGDPDNLLAPICTCAGLFAQGCECVQLQAQRRFSLSTHGILPFDSANHLSHPEWPTNLNTMHSYPRSAPAAPETVRSSFTPFFTHTVEPPREDAGHPNPLYEWLEPTYIPGYRPEGLNPSLFGRTAPPMLGSPTPSMLESPTPSILGSPNPSLPESPATGNASGRKRYPTKTNGYPCGHCPKLFDRHTDRKRHEKTHFSDNQKPNTCTQCGKGFIYFKDLKRHLPTHGSLEPKLFCSHVDCKNHKGFTRKDNYERHVRSKHSTSSINTAPSISGASTN